VRQEPGARKGQWQAKEEGAPWQFSGGEEIPNPDLHPIWE
jgi:hypothetical protein